MLPKLKKPQWTKNPTFRQTLAAICGSLSIFSVSSSFVWITPLLVRLQGPDSEVPMTSDQASWVVSLIELGDLVSTVPTGFLVNRVGRKVTLLATGPMFIFAWILVLCTRSVEVLYVVRVIQGLALGMLFTALPLYLAEISGPRIRGALGFFFQGTWYAGNLYEYCLGPFVSYQTLAWLSAIPPVLFVLTFAWFPESPYQHLLWGNTEEAGRSLAWFRGEEDTSTELDAIKRAAEAESGGGAWSELWGGKAGRRSLLLVHLVGFTYTLSGGTAIFSYVTLAFSQAGGGELPPYAYTIMMGVVVLVFVPLSASTVDRAGRRPVLLASTLGSGVCLLAATFYYAFLPVPALDSWLPYLSVTAYGVLMGAGIESVFPVLQAELFSNRARGLGAGLSHFTITIASFFTLKIYQVVNDSVGLYVMFAIYAVFAFLGFLLIYLYVPETKNKTFAEIQLILKD